MALFHQLAQLADQLAAEPSRLKKRAAIATAILSFLDHHKVLSPSAQHFVLYLAGQPFPESDPRKLSTGGALLSRALLTVAHATEAELSAAYRRHGDLGAAAFDLLAPTHNPPPTLTFAEISHAFDQLATARTTAARSATLSTLLEKCTPLEAKYLLKLMLGDMRIGVKQSLIEEAIAVAASTEDVPVSPAQVRHAVMLEADLGHAVTRAFNNTLADARMTLFHPLGFMLASPVDTPEEAIARFTEKPPKTTPAKKPRRKKYDPAEDFTDLQPLAASQPLPEPLPTPEDAQGAALPASAQDPAAFLEDKYDGMRVQLHCGSPTQPGRVALYSRNREDITPSFPELAEAFAHVTTPLILDGEVLAWNLATNQALPFATLGQRIGRKKVDNDLRRQVPVVFMAFDILFHNDQLLLDRPLTERRARLETLAAHLIPQTVSPLQASTPLRQHHLFTTPAPAEDGVQRLLLSPSTLVTSAQAIDLAYADARARANEGVMLKAANSLYLPGRRGLAWLKLKRTLETLDVVITGAEFGHGRRAGLLSDYTFAVQHPDPDGGPPQLLNVGKAYSGVTDAEILELTTWLKAHTLEDHGHFRTVEPLRILEVAFNNIMRSDRHASGFALRFPRILRIRDDKPLAEIDTLARVEQIYQSQPDRPVE